MKTFSIVAASGITLAIITACANNSPLPYPSANTSREAVSKSRVASGDRTNDASTPTLYVLNSGGGQAFSVGVYPNRGASLVRSLSLGKYGQGIAVDPQGRLYVGVPLSQGDPSGKAVLNIYASRGSKVVQTVPQSHPFGLLTLDASGDLYTTCAANRLCEYAPGGSEVLKSVPIRKIGLKGQGAVAHALSTDSSGNLAVSSANSVIVFAPGATTPYWTISGIAPGAIAFDTSGNLYIALNAGGSSPSVAVYAPGGTSPIQTITNSVVNPTGLALDKSGNLYVLNSGILNQGTCTQPPAVDEYPHSSGTPFRSVTTGLVCANAHTMVLDSSAYIYVSNGGFPDPGNVVVYSKSSNVPKRTVTQEIQNPIMLGVSP